MTIKQRLMALIVASTLLIVGVLTSFFISSQIKVMEKNLAVKAETYSGIAAKQAISAVAFSDRETAREVLVAISNDRDVASVLLTGDGGEILFSSGFASWKMTSAREPILLRRAMRLISVTPVTSLEGPTGMLVIELSMQHLEAARTRLLWIGVLTGGVALTCSVLMAWLIAHRLARRLRAIGAVMTTVAAGDLDQQPVADTRNDEVGVLSGAFNKMLARLKQLVSGLEGLVAERTRALAVRNTEMRLVFDQVDQGLLVVDLDGTIAPERSAMVETWLGPVPGSAKIVDFIRCFAPSHAKWFGVMWDSLKDELLPIELAASQLPQRFGVGERTFSWSYKPFETDGGGWRVLVIVSDITAQLARERSERDERETMSLLTRALRDRSGFIEVCDEVARLIERIQIDHADVARDVHTLKGVSAMLALESISNGCHALETAMIDRDDQGITEQRKDLAERWRVLADVLRPFLIGDHGLSVHEADLAYLETAVAHAAPPSEVSRIVASWRDERAIDRLRRIADYAKALAIRLGKPGLEVVIECEPDLRFPSVLSNLWSGLLHGVRNAIDHGIETADQRIAAGKPASSRLVLRASRREGALVIELVDDGRGIEWESIAAAARARGLPSATTADLEAALFADGLSTRTDVTEISGRGLGLAALRSCVESIDARLTVSSEIGAGTTIQIVWPIHPVLSHARAS